MGGPYNLNATVLLTCELAVGGVDTDPTTLVLSVKSPVSGTVTNYSIAGATLTRLATGKYQASIVANEPGDWLYHWLSTGTAAGAGQSKFSVIANWF